MIPTEEQKDAVAGVIAALVTYNAKVRKCSTLGIDITLCEVQLIGFRNKELYLQSANIITPVFGS